MQYYSLNKKAPKTSFEKAVRKGLAPDKGLYFPEKITPLDLSLIHISEPTRPRLISYAVLWLKK